MRVFLQCPKNGSDCMSYLSSVSGFYLSIMHHETFILMYRYNAGAVAFVYNEASKGVIIIMNCALKLILFDGGGVQFLYRRFIMI